MCDVLMTLPKDMHEAVMRKLSARDVVCWAMVCKRNLHCLTDAIAMTWLGLQGLAHTNQIPTKGKQPLLGGPHRGPAAPATRTEHAESGRMHLTEETCVLLTCSPPPPSFMRPSCAGQLGRAVAETASGHQLALPWGKHQPQPPFLSRCVCVSLPSLPP